MMLFKLACKNIKKSVKDYAIYFFTLVLGVAVFYVFNAIGKQTAMLNLSKSGYEIIKMLNSMMSGVSIFVSIILGFLIIYASRFLIKRRKKEFGIYMTLGMGKGKISRILFMETLLIGIVSLVIGLGIGIAASQVMSVVVVHMFEADMMDFSFVYSGEATIKTIVYFGIMYVLVMAFNAVSISKCKLINLLQAGKKNERIKIKNPFLCIAVFVVAAVLLGCAYYRVTLGYDKMTDKLLYLSIGMGAVGTFLMFWSLSGLILKMVSSMKGIYRKNLNTFILRQLDSRINTTVFSMTIICLLLFMTIGILSTALTLNQSFTTNLKNLAPVDLEIYKRWDLDLNNTKGEEYSQEQIADSKITARQSVENLGFSTKDNLKDILELNSYSVPEVTMRTTIGNKCANDLIKKYPRVTIDERDEMIRISDYNNLAKMYGKDTLQLNDDEYIMLANYDEMVKIRNEALSNGICITVDGKTYRPKYKKCKDGFLQMSSNPLNIGLVVVPDDAVNDTMRYRSYFLANYNAGTKEEKQTIENKIQDIENENTNSLLFASSKIVIYEASIGLGAMVAFIGIYLGIIFLISSAAILALKELSESTDNKERYEILRRIGADEKLINRSLFIQIGIFFLFPLLIAIIHSIFGIRFVNHIMEVFVAKGMLPSIAATAIVLVVIYGGYFLITYSCSKNIIKNKNNY